MNPWPAKKPASWVTTTGVERRMRVAVSAPVVASTAPSCVMLKATGDEAASFNARWDGWAYQVGVWKEKAFAPKLEDLMERERPPAPPPTPPQ